MKVALADIKQALGLPPGSEPGLVASGWSVDTRTLAPGDLFFALRGPNHDGHQFVKEAFDKGAVAAVVERPVEASGPVLEVPDVLAALHRLAGWAREHWPGRLVAVTGSAGKTTTKEIIARLLETALRAGKSAGNLNNHIGVPLSLLRLPENAEAAVIEIGMNHPGEIRQLARIARPDVGVVTNVGHAHLEFFNSIEDVALAKRELIEELPPAGVAVLNADDPLVAGFRQVHVGRTVTFGLGTGADVRATEVELRPDGVRFRVAGVLMETPLAGVHNLRNLLAALAAAGEFGLRPEQLRETVAGLSAAPMRGRRLQHRGITVFDDCYNSNPEALAAMLELLGAEPAGRRLAVLGEMLELGDASERLHREAGRRAAACGVNLLVGVRGAARQLVEGAIEAGLPAGNAFFFEDPRQAGLFIAQAARPGDAVLFKGSRGARLELALEEFLKA